jgi:hypothetical protein
LVRFLPAGDIRVVKVYCPSGKPNLAEVTIWRKLWATFRLITLKKPNSFVK